MKIVLTQQAYKKFMFGVMNCDKEIGYMGRVKFDKKTCTYTILNVYLPTQEVTGTTTDLDASSVAQCEIHSMNETGYYNAWLHSHVNMGAFWSGTDTSTIKEMGLKGLCVAVVGNKKREMKGAVYVHSEEDHVPDIFNDNVPVEIEAEVNEVNAIWLEEIKTRVRFPVYPTNEWKNHNKNTALTDTLHSRYNRNDFAEMYLNDDYNHYGGWQDEMLKNNPTNPHKLRTYTGTSNAYKKEMKRTIENAYKTKQDSECFLCGSTKLTMKILSELSRDQVQDIIDGNTGWPEAKKVELMSKWYYIPVSFLLK